jgi:hypothetical protein
VYGGTLQPTVRAALMVMGMWVRVGRYVREQCRRDQKFRLALGSFLEEYNNKVQIVTVPPASPPHVSSRMPSPVDRGGGSALRADGFATSTMHAGWLLTTPAVDTVAYAQHMALTSHGFETQLDDEKGVFQADPRFSFHHPYPPTKIMFIPDPVRKPAVARLLARAVCRWSSDCCCRGTCQLTHARPPR